MRSTPVTISPPIFRTYLSELNTGLIGTWISYVLCVVGVTGL